MTQHFDIHVPALADAPLDAALQFYQEIVPTLRLPIGDERAGTPEALAVRSIAIVFPRADHTHRGWQLAAVQDLAREVAPMRVNAIAGDDRAAIREALVYLREARGVTGQLLEVGPA